jgi:hypothetical protein
VYVCVCVGVGGDVCVSGRGVCVGGGVCGWEGVRMRELGSERGWSGW